MIDSKSLDPRFSSAKSSVVSQKLLPERSNLEPQHDLSIISVEETFVMSFLWRYILILYWGSLLVSKQIQIFYKDYLANRFMHYRN